MFNRPHLTTPADRLGCGTTLFEIRWPQQSTAIVAIQGEIDAANASQFVDFALRNWARTDLLVVDLSGVSFSGAAGLTALDTLNVKCAKRKIRWAVVSSPAIDRVLGICDPNSVLPMYPDAADALRALNTEPPHLLHLVPESS